ncbi:MULTISPECIES: NADP-dependent oxidoreductase [Streptomyces]|uniref:NADP-dependent oxidoreductase n=1 Tax=Streptomyces caniscabiei TaxID=2746961 RepID=A0ABU4N440_9ACTN|nr:MULTISPECIES: NADP-dependent oxidoreductase [Streptomyces]MBE4741940.1 NADP-dependent oxidoreductase [Streptomyces caniscabiei]MBE4762709.1 NADP-dependent oxidoreductase [Streptomyces caniscabiei]MBE4775971.1 NADP-dependent oxidoreductase [Streptomyces caniscabiei]MBE4790766.1 NADP-dependent oxidoreductase [Streptomyces caniscabiei]MBE4799929.1 NADP-dependent oxidoreductase [Streptomyces caniscabiei]
MRAVALESVPSAPAVTEVDTPRPGVGELLVKVAAASLNGIDIATAAGYLQGFMDHRFPLVLGGDFAGTVEALGEGVDGFAVGDEVFGVVLKPYLGAGSLAQYVTVPAGHGVARIPEGVTVEDAGALGVAGLTAMVCLDAVALAEGETVLISGAGGGVGALAVQLAAARGAKVIATARPGAQTDFVTGLTSREIHVVDFTADLEAQVRAIAPEGVDVVLHLAGDGPALAALLRPGGQLASATGLSQDDVKAHDVTVHTIMAAPGPKTLTSLAEQVASGALRVPVTATYPLEQAAEAFAAFGAGTPGKIAVSCS